MSATRTTAPTCSSTPTGEGTVFVDTNGNSFAKPITIVPLPPPADRRSYYQGMQYARITIPDAELYKISRGSDDGNLTDTRELFIGLLDMLPTGTRVVDSSSQQTSLSLTRTQYGTFAAYGEQNYDYDFLSFLNGRVHGVFDNLKRRSDPTDYYAEITYVYDDRLLPVQWDRPVVPGSVFAGASSASPLSPACSGPAASAPVFARPCGPAALAWQSTPSGCPQVSIPNDHVGRLYVPLEGVDMTGPTVHISFNLELTDVDNQALLQVAMDLVVGDYVSWCDTAADEVDLTAGVVPSILVGTESDNPPRLEGFGDAEPFTVGSEVETLQDGLVTLILEIEDDAENLEVYLEDVLVVHVNPGSTPDFAAIGSFEPTYSYDPNTRDATMHIPAELVSACPAADFSESFFGCTHKHVLRDKVITNVTDAYLVGSPSDAGAQDFMENMLGSGTAAVAARELGRDFEQYLTGPAQEIGSKTKIGLWINPGHPWGQTVHNSEYSLSQYVKVYVLYGVLSGVDGTVRRHMLSQVEAPNTLSTTIKYQVSAASLLESVLDDVIAIEVQATLPLDLQDACRPEAELRSLCAQRLEAAVAPHASAIASVHCLSVVVKGAACDGARRAASPPSADVEAVIALADSPDAFLDAEGAVASGALLHLQQTDSKTFIAPVAPDPPAKNAAAGSNHAMLIGAVAAAVGFVALGVAAWKAMSCRRGKQQPLAEVVTVDAVEMDRPSSLDKAGVEKQLFGDDPEDIPLDQLQGKLGDGRSKDRRTE